MQVIEGLALTFQRFGLSVSVDGGRGSWELDRSCSNGRVRLSWLEGFQGFSKARHQSIAPGRVNRRSRKRVGSQRGRHFSIPKDITRATLYGSAQVKLAGSDTSPLPL
jgi:hypothetical protein